MKCRAGRALAAALLLAAGLTPARADGLLERRSIRYVGEYHCVQGDTSLVLIVSTNPKSPKVTADFLFGSLPSGPIVPNGAFGMTGSLHRWGGAIDLQPDSWIFQPPGYVMIGLSGKSTDHGRSYSGSIVGGTGCTRFQIMRIDQ